jgi:MFS transporter, PAT family, beta-lactamase induction signal transducer AmpG
MNESPGERGRSVHPALFFVLYFSFGASGGFLAGAAENMYVAGGVSTAAFGAVLSISLAPQIAKVLWAPLVDTTLTPKIWYVAATVAVAAAIVVGAALPVRAASLPALSAVSVVVAVAGSFLGMAADSLMAHDTAPAERGAAGGWSQAGNLGGAGVGASASLAIAAATHSLLLAGLGVAALTSLCALGLVFAPRSHSLPRHPSYLQTLKAVVKDCWDVVRARLGWLTLFLFVLPLGAGGAANLAAGIAHEWRVGPGLLASLALGGAIATGLGSIVGGYVCDRMDRRAAYVLFGVLCGVAAAMAAVAPKTPEWFVAFGLSYNAALGMAYAAYAAANLEAIGRGAAATKYTLFASVANIPVTLMPLADGWADTRGGPNALLWLEFGAALAAAIVFALVVVATRPRRVLAAA